MALALLVVVGIFSTAALATRPANAQTPTYITIDLSQTPNPQDYPFGITKSTSDNDVYVSIFQQCMLAKIDPNTKTVITLIQNPNMPSSSTDDCYSVSDDGLGNIWMNEATAGRVWKYNIANDTWTQVNTVPQLFTNNSKVTYPQTYAVNPAFINVDANPSPTGNAGHAFRAGGFSSVVNAGGYIWVGLKYDIPFSDDEKTYANVTDVHFSGLAKINPTTNVVEQIAIPQLNDDGVSGMVADGSSIWISDPVNSQVLKFDTNTNTVTTSATLPTNSNPWGIAVDSNNVYVALNENQANLIHSNSTIAEIPKANTSSVTYLDTGAPTTDEGTYSVFVVGQKLFWTNLSGAVGNIDLVTGAKTHDGTSSWAADNHFGTQVGSEFWWAAHGSAKVGMVPLEEPQQQQSSNTPSTTSNDSSKSGTDARMLQHYFIAPEQSALDSVKGIKTIESAAQPYDYFHNGIRAYVEYVHFKLVLGMQSDPTFKNLTPLQQDWLFAKVKPQLDEAFNWIPA